MIIYFYYIFLSFTFLCLIEYGCQQSQLISNQAYAFHSTQVIDVDRHLPSIMFPIEKDILIYSIDSTIPAEKSANIKNNISKLSDSTESNNFVIEEFPVPSGSRPHDVAPASDGTIWYTAQGSGDLGHLDPNTGEIYHIDLGSGSAPHGVIVGPDGAPWITDGGLNAIVRVDPATEKITIFSLPEKHANANLNTATFDGNGILWFTGQSRIFGYLDPKKGHLEVFYAPRGPGPYGITTTPDGKIYFASLAGSYIARINSETGNVTVLEPPTPDQGARRVWSDSNNKIWVSEWIGGKLAVYDANINSWKEWQVPGENPSPYAVYVDEHDKVWISDFGSNLFLRFDPLLERFEEFKIPSNDAKVRQILGSPGEVWGAESGTDKLVRVRANN